jgi:hypothetical protein
VTEELHKGLIRLGGKPFRRVRKHKGETWKPGQRNEPNAELGVWCKWCRTTHPWRNRKTLVAKYERRASGAWVIMWTCGKTGNVLKETTLTMGGNHGT